MPRSVRGMLVAVALGACVALAASCSGDDSPRECNLHEELCDRPLNEVAFATTHNSMSNIPDRWIDPTQTSGIGDQLEAGIRGFQIDSYYGVDAGRGVILTAVDVRTAKMSEEHSSSAIQQANRIASSVASIRPSDRRGTYLCHGNCELGAIPMVDALNQFKEFLDGHPNEVFVIFIEDYISAADTEAAFEQAGLIDYLYTYDGGEWPTLGEMIDSGKRVLVMSENGGGDPAWYHRGFELTQETPYRFESTDELLTETSCDLNRGAADSPLFQLNHFVSPADRRASATTNEYQFLLDRARKCQEQRGLVPNLVAVNLWGEGSVVDVVDEINGVR